LKLAPLLAQYLYSNKRLDLPGIGSFFLDPSAVVTDAENSKQSKSSLVEGISFESNPSIKESGDLIGYISTQTGKMKALAAADLSSHLELVQQFLNIGKPFLLEGIGSLVKIKSGQFEFTSGAIQAEKLKDLTAKEATVTSATEESFSSYDPLTGKQPKGNALKKPVMALLIVLGAGLAIWGGYTVYKKNSADKVAAAADTIQTQPVAIDSSAIKKDSTPVAVNGVPPGNYKFVLETAGKTRAMERYKKLTTFEWKVQMETKDSLQYKLYMVLPATIADTTRIRDSLTALNGKRVSIEL
jgi:hypothetical protein